jgi:hypothetical protein
MRIDWFNEGIGLVAGPAAAGPGIFGEFEQTPRPAATDAAGYQTTMPVFGAEKESAI